VEEPEYLEKSTDLSQITDTFYHMMLYWVYLGKIGIRTQKFRKSTRHLKYLQSGDTVRYRMDQPIPECK
jgi:hypothetical protein